MSKRNFAVMSDRELRTYVLSHISDREAFHAYCDRLYAKPGIKITSQEQFEQLIRQKEGINSPSQSE